MTSRILETKWWGAIRESNRVFCLLVSYTPLASFSERLFARRFAAALIPPASASLRSAHFCAASSPQRKSRDERVHA